MAEPFPLTFASTHDAVMEYLATRHALDVAKNHNRPGLEEMPGARTWHALSEKPQDTSYGAWLAEQFTAIRKGAAYDSVRFPEKKFTPENLKAIAERFGPVLDRAMQPAPQKPRMRSVPDFPKKPDDPA